MMEKFFKKFRSFLSPRKYLAMVFLAMFMLGYFTTTARVQQCNAQGIQIGFAICCNCPVCIIGAQCEVIMTSMMVSSIAISELTAMMQESTAFVEAAQQLMVNEMVAFLLTRINIMEMDIKDWWNTMWEYSMLPSLQSMTDQLSTAVADQTRQIGSTLDASNQLETQFTMQKTGLKDHRMLRPSENICVAATTAGGFGRAETFDRAMRMAWARESQATGYNKVGTMGAAASVAAEKKRYDEYRDLFCDPNGNGGANDCGASIPKYYDADTQPTAHVYNKLTIDVADPVEGANIARTVETINNNLIGVPSADPISLGSLKSATGQQTFLDRRSYLARHGAIRTIPQIVAGWRMPGSQMGTFVRELREAAGIPLTNISANPSYREVMHSVSIDRFNSGQYALGMITDESSIEMEKLALNAFYLMQLRDYYELLERTALTLAVQVSVMIDQEQMPDAVSVAPLKP